MRTRAAGAGLIRRAGVGTDTTLRPGAMQCPVARNLTVVSHTQKAVFAAAADFMAAAVTTVAVEEGAAVVTTVAVAAEGAAEEVDTVAVAVGDSLNPSQVRETLLSASTWSIKTTQTMPKPRREVPQTTVLAPA